MRIKRYLGKLVCFLRTFFLLGLSFLIIPAFGFFSLAYGHDASLSTTKIKSLISEPLPEYSTILASDGSVIATFYSENRIPTISSDISPLVKKALIATEDARFYSHHGVDWIGTARALISQLEGHGGGGSTITQQYVKNLLVAHASTAVEAASATATNLTRKIKEARGALAIEKVLTKDQILTGYLNTVYFGDGSYGIGAAAEHYFSIAPKDLTLPQAALLVGIVQNPTGLNPRNHPEAAKLRRHHVLSRMLITHAITQEEFNTATSTPITLTISEAANGCAYSPYPQYCQWIRQSLENDPVFGATASARESFLYSGGLTIKTAMEPKAQNAITLAAKKALDPKGTIAVGIAVVRPGTGEVVALGKRNRADGTSLSNLKCISARFNF
jgi:membrane peptidoglycan carboxypeptidase